jgi:hypothetical protein
VGAPAGQAHNTRQFLIRRSHAYKSACWMYAATVEVQLTPQPTGWVHNPCRRLLCDRRRHPLSGAAQSHLLFESATLVRRGVSVAVDGIPWNALLTFGAEAGPVPHLAKGYQGPCRSPCPTPAGPIFKNSRLRRAAGNISPTILNPCRYCAGPPSSVPIFLAARW